MPFTVPEHELRFRASPAAGPGGQHVNRSSTRIEVRWDITNSPSVSDSQRELLLEKLGSRVDSRGVLRVTADERRSQLRNREAAVKRLNELANKALEQPRPRKKTKPPAGAAERRLAEKKRRAELKRERRRPDTDD